MPTFRKNRQRTGNPRNTKIGDNYKMWKRQRNSRTERLIELVAVVASVVAVSQAAAQQSPVETNQVGQLVLRAAAAVKPDGELSEWNNEGRLGPVTFDEEVKDEFNATFYAMYDQENLYLATEVIIPHPPYNTYPVRGVGAWNGDDVIVRMSSNPALRVPLEMSQETMAKSPDLFTAEFWWNHLKNAVCWDAYRGIQPDKMLTGDQDLPGSAAAIKPKPDGKGYTLEARLPWKVINAAFVPKAGDVIALTWEVSVSNGLAAEPKRSFQIFGNGGGTWAFTNPGMWGRATFR